MIVNKRIKFPLLTLLILFVVFSTDTFTIDSNGSPSVSEDTWEINSYSDEIFPSISELNFFSFPPDTNLTLKQLDSLKADSLKLGLIEIDSSMYDSTARLKHFQYVREDNKFLNFQPERKKSFFSYPSQRYLRRTVELDSTGNYVIIRELIANEEVREPLKIPLEQYIEMRLNSTERNEWENLGYKYDLVQGQR